MSRLDLIAWTILLISTCGICQGATIRGNAAEYKGQTIRLFTYGDFITETLEQVSEAQIADDGSFTLQSNLDYTYLALLRIGDVYANLYLEPAATHEIQFPVYKATGPDLYSKQRFVRIEEVDQKAESLNALINKFNYEFDTFVDSIKTVNAFSHAKPAIQGFDQRQRKAYSQFPIAFLQDYVEYQMALLKLMTNTSRKELYSDHLYKRKILYHNDAYIQFITSFYDGYLTTLFIKGHETEILQTIKKRDSDALLSVLQNTDILVEGPMAEFVALIEFYNNRSRKNPNPMDLIAMIERISLATKIPDHQKLAKNMLHSIQYLQAGSPAPDFKLLTPEGDTLTLADFKGKYTYLEFWATWCTTCMKEMSLTKGYTTEFPRGFAFLSIALDSEPEAVSKTVESKGFEWNFAHDGIDNGLRDRYQIKTLPTYFIIDPEGNMYQSPAPSPSSGIHQSLWEIDQILHPSKDDKVLQSQQKPPGFELS